MRVFSNNYIIHFQGNENYKAGHQSKKQGGAQDKLSNTQPDRFQKGGDQKYEIGIIATRFLTYRYRSKPKRG
jgi:hypothetical protein